jgi:hypothetical protein
VTIEFPFDISNQSQTVGTFEVTEGADELGCEAGTAVNNGISAEIIATVMDCDGGTITVHFDPEADPAGGGAFIGQWNIVEGTGDFERLGGGGELTSVRDSETLTIAQTLSGELQLS